MKRGVVKFYNNEKGFGFIVDSDSKEDVFVHKTGTRTRINEGDQVSYEVEDGQKGPSAVNVELV